MQEFVNGITKIIAPFFLIFLGILFIFAITILIIRKPKNSSRKSQNKSAKFYVQKPFMTNSEFVFYKKLKILESRTDGKVIIAPQINLATILKKVRNGDRDFYQNELYRNIDFAIFSRDYQKLLLLIELNDTSHFDKKRRARDAKVREICEIANVKLLTFYTDKPNETDYVISRILDKIKEQK